MVAAKDQSRGINPFLTRQLLDENPETGRRHAGIAAELIHLIARRLDQDRRVVIAIAGEDGAERLRVSGAPGRDAPRFASAVGRDDVGKRVHARASRNASISGNELLPSIGPTLPTASAPAALARRNT